MKSFFKKTYSILENFLLSKPFYAFLFGFVAVGALPPYHGLLCLFIGFSGLIGLLNKAETKKQAAWIGFMFGFGHFSFGLSWVSNALLTEGLGFEWLAPLPPIGFGLWGAFFPMAACLIAFQARKGWRRLIAFAAAWGVFEWVRAWFLTGFPWNLIATSWVSMPSMLQTSSWWGAYGLGIITVLTATLPTLFFWNKAQNLTKKQKLFHTFGAVFVPLIVLSTVNAYGEYRLKKAPAETDTIRGITLRLVQANVPQGKKWNPEEAEQNLMKHVHLSRAPGAENITHVIWPETATQFLLAQDEFARAMAINGLRGGSILLAGSLRSEPIELPEEGEPPYKVYNSILVFDDSGFLIGSYDKSHLVPFGEYAPLRSVFPFMKKFTPGEFDFSAGEKVKTVVLPRTLPIGMLVCYEAIFPGNVVNKEHRPYWLLNVTNDGWYGLSAGPYQHFASAQMRAVEEGIPLVRAANTGISGVIDSYGRVTASLPLGIRGHLDAGLPRRTEKPTLYADFGNTIPLSIAILMLLIAFLPITKKKTEANDE